MFLFNEYRGSDIALISAVINYIISQICIIKSLSISAPRILMNTGKRLRIVPRSVKDITGVEPAYQKGGQALCHK